MPFYDTALDYDPKNVMSHPGLTVFSGGKYVAPLDDLSQPRQHEKVKLNEWLNKIVFVDKEGRKMTREELILAIANTDGGTHVDKGLDEDYANISRLNSLGWITVKNGQTAKLDGNPAFVSMRQLAHELLKSLKDEFPECF